MQAGDNTVQQLLAAPCRPLVYRGLELRAGSCLPRLLLYLGPALLLSILANTPRLLEMRLVTILDTDSGNHLTLVTPASLLYTVPRPPGADQPQHHPPGRQPPAGYPAHPAQARPPLHHILPPLDQVPHSNIQLK